MTEQPSSSDLAGLRRLPAADRVTHIRGTCLERVLTVSRSAIDEGKRTIWLSVSSEYPVPRWYGNEILDHDEKSIRTERLRSGLAVLVDHDTAKHIGIVDDFKVSADRKLRTLARFGKNALAEEKFRDLIDGILVNVSVRYIVHDLVLESSTEGVDTYRITDWEPVEVSFAAVPADPTVGAGRQLERYTTTKGHHMEQEHNDVPATAPEYLRLAGSTPKPELADALRIRALFEAGRACQDIGGLEVAAELAQRPGATTETLRAVMFERQRGKQKPFGTAAPFESPAHYGLGARELLAKPRYFKGENAQEQAYRAGMWLKGFYGNEDARRWCGDNGLELRAMSAALVSQGGALVPNELSATVIDLSDSFGAFRANANNWPMSSDTLGIPKSLSDPEASFVGESGSLPEDQGDWGLVNLTAKKIGVIVRVPTELLEDSVIDVADRVAFQLSRAFAKKEDQCGFLGDGTSTFGGMTGIFTKLVSGSHNASKILAGTDHDTFAEIDVADLAKVVAALPEYALEGAKWYCSGSAWGTVFFRLMNTAGGNTASDMAGAVPKQYGGFPVVTSPVLPAGASTDYSGQVMIAFGNLRRASSFGARREIRIQMLTERYADVDQVGIKATERFDIVNHDLGDNTTAGPIVGLVGN